jgi:hypothetical protein
MAFYSLVISLMLKPLFAFTNGHFSFKLHLGNTSKNLQIVTRSPARIGLSSIVCISKEMCVSISVYLTYMYERYYVRSKDHLLRVQRFW